MQMLRHKGFTLIELLIVLSIIAILAATVAPNFIGFDKDARVSGTKANLEVLRSQVSLYRAREGKYPATLEELTTTTYNDAGVTKKYLDKMPVEMISSKDGNNDVVNTVSTQAENLSGDGGWAYYTDTAGVAINISEELDKTWSDNEGEDPQDW